VSQPGTPLRDARRPTPMGPPHRRQCPLCRRRRAHEISSPFANEMTDARSSSPPLQAPATRARTSTRRSGLFLSDFACVVQPKPVTALIKMAHGGRREGAGRKKSVRRGGPHRVRPELSARHPVHVVLRMNGGTELRQSKAYHAVRIALRALLDETEYRVVHLSIQNNHLHLLIEAQNKRALQRCMQRFTIRAARTLQAAFGWSGKIFPWRYHATQITTPRQARNTLAYVLNNWRRHREDAVNATTMKASFDPYSSGISFDGWIGAPQFATPGYELLDVRPPSTALLRSDWKRWGLIDLFERPGPTPIYARRGRLY